MKTAKLGALFLVSIMALAGTGMAYAWWQEDLVIDGTVTTGTFGWEFTLDDWGLCGDYKDIVDAGVYLGDYADEDEAGNPIYPKSLNFYAYDMYPCVSFWFYWDLHFYGSVPGHIDDVNIVAYEDDILLDGVPDYVYLYCNVIDASPRLIAEEGIVLGEQSICNFIYGLECTQWHECEYIDIIWGLHLIEEGMVLPDGSVVPPGVEVPMDTELEITITFHGVQYNYVD